MLPIDFPEGIFLQLLRNKYLNVSRILNSRLRNSAGPVSHGRMLLILLIQFSTWKEFSANKIYPDETHRATLHWWMGNFTKNSRPCQICRLFLQLIFLPPASLNTFHAQHKQRSYLTTGSAKLTFLVGYHIRILHLTYVIWIGIIRIMKEVFLMISCK